MIDVPILASLPFSMWMRVNWGLNSDACFLLAFCAVHLGPERGSRWPHLLLLVADDLPPACVFVSLLSWVDRAVNSFVIHDLGLQVFFVDRKQRNSSSNFSEVA